MIGPYRLRLLLLGEDNYALTISVAIYDTSDARMRVSPDLFAVIGNSSAFISTALAGYTCVLATE